MARALTSKAILKQLSASELQELLAWKVEQERKKLPALKERRDRLSGEIESLKAEIAAIEGAGGSARSAPLAPSVAPSRRGRGAARRRPSYRAGRLTLPAAITQVLGDAGKPMAVADVIQAILDKQLIPKPARSFAQQVRIALIRHKEFKRKGRGVYSL